MRLKDLIAALKTGARSVNLTGASGEADITGIEYDSRRITLDGRGVIFAAMPGEHVDGASFARDALRRGAVAVLACKALPELNAPQIIAPDVREAVAELSAVVYGEPSKKLCLAGVTGTNGKTTTTYLIESIFNESGFKCGVMGTVNYRYAGKEFDAPHTTPEAPDLQKFLKEMVDAGVTHAVMEVSSHALHQKRAHAAAFDAAVFTNLTHEHLDYHKTMDEYYRCKAMLFKELMKDGAMAVINADDPWGQRLMKETRRPLGYSMKSGADIYPKTHRLEAGGLEAVIATPAGDVEVASPLTGEYNLQNIMAAVGSAIALGFEPGRIARGVAALKRVPGRLDKVLCRTAGKNFIAYVDYAHTADALERVLGALRAMAKGRIITVFGCGGNRDAKKRPVMGSVSAALSDVTIITSDNPRGEEPSGIIREIEAGIKGARRIEASSKEAGSGCYMVIPDRREAVRKAVLLAQDKDIILVAGKGHEDYQIIKDAKFHFSDFEVLREAINEASGERG